MGLWKLQAVCPFPKINMVHNLTGAALPIYTLIFGKLVNAIGKDTSNDELASQVNSIVIYFVYLAAGTFVASYFEVTAWMLTGRSSEICGVSFSGNCGVTPFTLRSLSFETLSVTDFENSLRYAVSVVVFSAKTAGSSRIRCLKLRAGASSKNQPCAEFAEFWIWDSALSNDTSSDRESIGTVRWPPIQQTVLSAVHGGSKFLAAVGARQSNRLRERYFASVLRQEISYFDVHATSGVLLHGLQEDINAVQNAIGEKVGNFIHNLCTFVVGIAVGKLLNPG